MMTWRMWVSGATACAVCAIAPLAVAHEGPEHEIEELTQRMKENGETADLLLERAIEYAVLQKSAEAIKDLERALIYEPHSSTILRELGRAYLATGKSNEASAKIDQAIKHAETDAELGSAWMVKCDIRRERKDYARALDAADEAIRAHATSMEWYLTRSGLQRVLGLHRERIKGLEEGVKLTGSGLLETELLDAMIDGGKHEQALPRVEAELKDARLKSTWLMRRAKIRLAMNKREAAKGDLQAALEELNGRLGRSSPDPLVLYDRGQIQDLLGNREEAKKDYESARNKGVDDDWLRERIRVVRGDDKKKEEEKKDDKSEKDDKNDKDDKESKDDKDGKDDGDSGDDKDKKDEDEQK